MLRLAILTTPTPHHCYFVSKLPQADILVISETGAVKHPYPTAHVFENERDAYEISNWFGGRETTLSEFAETESYDDINEATERMESFAPEVAVCFGTRLLRPPIIRTCRNFLNLHGGDPQHYRGLDTHLWAIWHHDFGALKTCLHRVNPALDDGELVALLPIPITPAMKLHELRKANTEVCATR